MPFTLLNDPAASVNAAAYTVQAQPDKVDYDILVAGSGGTGISTGCAVTTGGAMTVNVAAGTGAVAGTSMSITAAAGTAIAAAHATLGRLDLVVTNASGTVSVTTGTAAATPCMPNVPASSAAIAEVYVPPTTTTITSSMIRDLRVPPVLTPWLVTVDAFLVPFANTNWNDLVTGSVYRSPVTGDPGATTNPFRASTGAQNAELEYRLLLGAGTWAFDWQGVVSTHSGIMTVLIDDASVGTLDLYYTALAYSYVQSVTGIVVTSTAVHSLKLRMAAKNASSDNYYGYVQTFQMRRTA